MGRNCIVFGCSNTPEKGVSLFKFPTDSKLRKAWILRVQRTTDKWRGPSKYSAICCEHFTEDCFEMTPLNARKPGIKMKSRLMPTIFLRPASSTAVTKRLRESSAFEKREKARVTYSYLLYLPNNIIGLLYRYSLRLLLLVQMPLLVWIQHLSSQLIEWKLMMLLVIHIYSNTQSITMIAG